MLGVGYNVSAAGLQVEKRKTLAIEQWLAPTNVKGL